MSIKTVLDAERKLEQRVIEQAEEIETLRALVKNQAERLRILDRAGLQFGGGPGSEPRRKGV